MSRSDDLILVCILIHVLDAAHSFYYDDVAYVAYGFLMLE